MKKSLTLVMAMAFGITASAYAANPFSDVPAGHWAYDSVAKLVTAGVVDGYADGAFDGNKLMTRYEMAQIVAKAMAKDANVDKLAAEFADELDAFGVRVAKLEKDSDAVKITGEVRYHYADMDIQKAYSSYGSPGDPNIYVTGKKHNENQLRSRIWIQGAVNEDWIYTGMLQNTQDFDNETGDEETKFKRAYVEGKIGGVDVLAGRYNAFLVNGNLYDEHADGIELSYGKDVKFTAFYIKPTDQNGTYFFEDSGNDEWHAFLIEYGKAYGMKIDSIMGKVKATVGYNVFKDGLDKYVAHYGYYPAESLGKQKDNKIWNLSVNFDVTKDLSMNVDYMKSNLHQIKGQLINGSYKSQTDFDSDDGLVIGLKYKGAKANEVGSYGLYTNYYDQSRGTVVAHTMNGFYGNNGFEGYMIGANYTLDKNIIASIEWYDLQSKGFTGTISVPKQDMETLWTQVVFTF